MKNKTFKQLWQFERAFNHAGSLARIRNVLKRMIEAESTLPNEAAHLKVALMQLSKVNFRKDLDRSWKKFSHKKEE